MKQIIRYIPNGKPENKITIACLWDGDFRYIGIARVNPDSPDKFCKKIGRNIALTRAHGARAYSRNDGELWPQGMKIIKVINNLNASAIGWTRNSRGGLAFKDARSYEGIVTTIEIPEDMIYEKTK